MVTVCISGENRGLVSGNSALSIACGIVSTKVSSTLTSKCSVRGFRCIVMSKDSFRAATTFLNMDLKRG